MPARFADIKFNLMHAIELFEDMNHLDMDVSAPPSDHTFYKEIEVAQRLNIFLGQLIEEGVFDDCERRDEDDDEASSQEAIEEEDGDEEEGQEESTSPKSEGFNLTSDEQSDSAESEDSGSRTSFTDRFKRYIRRIIPGRRRGSSSPPVVVGVGAFSLA